MKVFASTIVICTAGILNAERAIQLNATRAFGLSPWLLITTVATFEVTEMVAGIASGVGSVSVAMLPSLFTFTIP